MHITYLLGAGASAACVPLVKEIPERLLIYEKYINKFDNPLIDEYTKEIKKLVAILDDNNTIDSYARNLYQNKFNNQSQELNKLKAIVIGLFLFEQLPKKKSLQTLNEDINSRIYSLPDKTEQYTKVNRTIDSRYKTFLGKVLTDNHSIDQNISILSWNYDLQIEIALEIVVGYRYRELHEGSLIFPHPNHYFDKSKNEIPQIIKMNGTAGIFKEYNKTIFNVYDKHNEYFDDIIDTIMEIFKEAASRIYYYNPLLKFAWEKGEYSESVLHYALKTISKTTTLVVIGYSFPDFNRSIDRGILLNSEFIEEVYFQMPASDEKRVRYNLKAVNKELEKKCEVINELDEFLLPPNY